MSRLPILIVVLATVATVMVSTAAAAPPDGDVTINLTAPPSATVALRNATVLFDVQVHMANLGCLPGPGTLTIDLTASSGSGNGTTNSTGGITIAVTPASMKFVIPNNAVNFNSPAQSAGLVLSSNRELTRDVTITATVAGLTECIGAGAVGAPATTVVKVTFAGPGTTVTGNGADNAPVPSIGIPILALGLVAVALVARRQK